jgi:hypothetical protein
VKDKLPDIGLFDRRVDTYIESIPVIDRVVDSRTGVQRLVTDACGIRPDIKATPVLADVLTYLIFEHQTHGYPPD